MKTKIYGLTDENGMIRYVGKTRQPLQKRFHRHMADARNGRMTHNHTWIRSVLSKGRLPGIVSIEEAEGNGDSEEMKWIALFWKYGVDLTNATDGGEGGHGFRMSEENKDRLRKRMTGNKFCLGLKQTPERKRAQSLALKGKPHSPEHNRHVSIARKGYKMTEEQKEKLRLANLGKTVSIETRQKLSLKTKAYWERQHEKGRNAA